MFAMSRQLKGALMAAGGGVCWGISGTMGQYLFTHEAMQTTWLIPIRLSLAGLILFVYWLVKGVYFQHQHKREIQKNHLYDAATSSYPYLLRIYLRN